MTSFRIRPTTTLPSDLRAGEVSGGDVSRGMPGARTALVWLALLAGLAVLYRDVIPALVQAWWTDDNYSHGFLIPPLAAYLAWERRYRFAAVQISGSVTGLVVVLGSLLVLATGVLGIELFLMRISLVGVVAGSVLFLYGWARFRVMGFPLLLLLLMIPLPAIIFNQIAFPLQLVASQFGETVIRAFAIPVLREGNVLVLPNITLEVAEACSGIRSLVTLLTLGIVFAYFVETRIWARSVIVASTVPVAIIANGLRVAGTGVAARYVGVAAAEGFLHEFSGWLVFVVAFSLILLLQRILQQLFPVRGIRAPLTHPAV